MSEHSSKSDGLTSGHRAVIRANPRMTDWRRSGVVVDGVEIETFVEDGCSIGAWGDGLGVLYGADRLTAAAGLVFQVLSDKALAKAAVAEEIES